MNFKKKSRFYYLIFILVEHPQEAPLDPSQQNFVSLTKQVDPQYFDDWRFTQNGPASTASTATFDEMDDSNSNYIIPQGVLDSSLDDLDKHLEQVRTY